MYFHLCVVLLFFIVLIVLIIYYCFGGLRPPNTIGDTFILQFAVSDSFPRS